MEAQIQKQALCKISIVKNFFNMQFESIKIFWDVKQKKKKTTKHKQNFLPFLFLESGNSLSTQTGQQ